MHCVGWILLVVFVVLVGVCIGVVIRCRKSVILIVMPLRSLAFQAKS